METQTVSSPRRMREIANEARTQGKRIGLVPTMGYLHEGHMSLLRLARSQCDVLVMSLFVNPKQFGPNEDLARYPSDTIGDLQKAKDCQVDFVFAPDASSMYPSGFQTVVEVPKLATHLCGASRPGHFAGVCTVVAKLFHLVLPHVAVFGEKDIQQLAILQQMVTDLDFGIEIVGAPIVREPDGLALSSRNVYLSADERQQAVSIRRGLRAAEQRLMEGARDRPTLVGAARAVIGAAPLARIDYVQLCDETTLELIQEVKEPAILAAAVFFGRTRLIDNIRLTRPGV